MTALTYRNRRGELVDIEAVPATRIKTEFGAILEELTERGAIAITRHDTPKAVLLSYAEFEALAKLRAPALHDLSSQFDALLDRMQAPKAKKGMAAAFNASPAELGKAAQAAAVKAAATNGAMLNKVAAYAAAPRKAAHLKTAAGKKR